MIVAARKKNEIQVVGYLLQEDGSAVPFEELTKEQKDRWWEGCARRLSSRLNAYYSQHPEEYAKL